MSTNVTKILELLLQVDELEILEVHELVLLQVDAKRLQESIACTIK